MKVKELIKALRERADPNTEVMFCLSNLGRQPMLLVLAKKELGGVPLGAHLNQTFPLATPHSLLHSEIVESSETK